MIVPGLVFLLLGLGYYLLFRDSVAGLQSLPLLGDLPLLNLQAWVGDRASPVAFALPSFLHAAALAWWIVAYGCVTGRRYRVLLILHVAMTLAFEFLIGTTSYWDMVMLLLGTAAAGFAALHFCGRFQQRQQLLTDLLLKDLLLKDLKGSSSPDPLTSSNTAALPAVSDSHLSRSNRDITPATVAGRPAIFLLLISAFFTLASGPVYNSGPYYQYQPVYMSYQDLRSAISVSALDTPAQLQADPLDDVQRVYVYGDYLFLNQRNTGLHIVDNSNTASPRRIAFLNIPGNTDVAIRQGYLYADSYVDLVTLDVRNLSDLASITEVDREEGLYPYNAYQNVPQEVYFDDIDIERGVVVDYRRRN